MTASPIFLQTWPEIKPRTECGCHPVAFMSFFRSCPTRPLQQVEDRGGLVALAGASCWLRLFGCFGRFVALLARGGLLGRLPLGGRDTGLPCANVGLLGPFRLLARADSLVVL